MRSLAARDWVSDKDPLFFMDIREGSRGGMRESCTYQIPQPWSPDLAHRLRCLCPNAEVRGILHDVELDRVACGGFTVHLHPSISTLVRPKLLLGSPAQPTVSV